MTDKAKTEMRDRPDDGDATTMWRGRLLPKGLSVEMAEKIEKLVEDYEDSDRFAYEVVLDIWGIVRG